MDKRKKYFCVMAVVLILLSGYGKISDSAFRMQMARMIAGNGMLRLVVAQYGQKAAKSVAETASDRSEKEDRPRVALTFDDGPHATYTPLLLDGLRKRGIHATFFLMGKNIRGNEEIVMQMQRDGHLIGNHTYDHVQLDKISGDQACQQIIKTNNEIYEITGEYPMYLRPPYGAWPKDLELCVTMLPVFWDVDTLDWKSKNVRSVENIVKRQVKDGSIILMHEIYQNSYEALELILDQLYKQGYEVVSVSELLGEQVKPGTRHSCR